MRQEYNEAQDTLGASGDIASPLNIQGLNPVEAKRIAAMPWQELLIQPKHSEDLPSTPLAAILGSPHNPHPEASPEEEAVRAELAQRLARRLLGERALVIMRDEE